MTDWTDETRVRLEAVRDGLPVVVGNSTRHRADIRAALGEIERLREEIIATADAISPSLPGVSKLLRAITKVVNP